MPRLSDLMNQNTVENKKSFRLGDLVSMANVETLDLNKTGLIEIDENTKRTWDSRGKIGLFEALSREDTSEKLPFNPEAAIKIGKVLYSVNRIQNEEGDQGDFDRLNSYILKMEEERHRGFTLPAEIGKGLLSVPGFMLEFLATGGLASLGKKTVTDGAAAALDVAVKKATERFVRTTTGMMTKAATRTALMPHRVVEGFAGRQVESSFKLTDKGVEILKNSQEKPYISAVKAFGDVMIENFSEETGEVIGKAASGILPKSFTQAYKKIVKKLHPNDPISKFFTKAGFHGILEEMGEERVGNFLRALTGVEDFGGDRPERVMDRISASFPNAEQLLVEAGIFSITGGFVSGVNLGADKASEFIRGKKSLMVETGQKEVPQEFKAYTSEDAHLEEPQLVSLTEEKIDDILNVGSEISEGVRLQPDLEQKAKKRVVSDKFQGGIRTSKQLAQGVIEKTQQQKVEARLERLDQEIKSIDRQMELLEEQRNLLLKSRRSTKNVDQKLDKLLQDRDSVDVQRADLLTSLPEEFNLQGENLQITGEEFDVATILGFKEGRKAGRQDIITAKQILDKRRLFIREAQKQFGLTDAEVKLIHKRDIRLMNNYEFKLFIDSFRAKAAEFAEKRQVKSQILFQIHEKELKKTENFREFLKLPPIEKMSLEQLKRFDTEMEAFQEGDEFLSLRKLQTVKNTDLAGIRTVREAKEILARKMGVPFESLNNIKVSSIDKFRFDTSLARANPFYEFLVDETNMSLLDGEQKFYEMETEVDTLVKKARKSRKKSLVDKLIPSDEIVFKWLEAPSDGKEIISKEMTPEEIDLASYLQSRFAEFRDYLVKHEVLKHFKTDYITHIRKGFLETWKDDGLLEAFNSVFQQYQEDESVFKILDDDTQNILPLEKFFQFSLKRTGEIKPSKNVAKAFKTYAKTFFKKQSLDKIVPALDIYANALAPKAKTPRGLEMDRRLVKFVREWINNKKGRRSSFGGVIPQAGVIDLALRGINAFVTIVDLGLNIPVSLASNVGEQIVTFIGLGSNRYKLGLQRMNKEKGKEIIEKNRALVGKSLWRELQDGAATIGDQFHRILFGLFSISNENANKIHLLGSMTEQEWEAGELSEKRRAIILREMGRFRAIPGSKSIFGSTSVGSTLTKYKTWALPILNTVIEDLRIVAEKLSKGDAKAALSSKEFHELFRGTMTSAVVYLVGGSLVDDDDKSFLGEILKKIHRESLTFIAALDPTTITSVRLYSFIQDLSYSLQMIAALEKYKTKGRKGLKGLAKLQRTITPRAVKTLFPEKN